MNWPRRKRSAKRPHLAAHSAVSLPEVLIVLALILFLLALLVPGLADAKERARRVQCANNLRQWGIALQSYRDEYGDYLPTEGTFLNQGLLKPWTWYNALPPYLGAPSYGELEHVNTQEFRELKNVHVWVCPSKNLTDAYKSGSGKNQFHYGMNQVLDGLGSLNDPSRDAPDFPDGPDEPLPGRLFRKKPQTAYLFDIAMNLPSGTPRRVATRYAVDYEGRRMGEFHGDYTNVLCLSGGVVALTTDDIVSDKDFRYGEIQWSHPRVYWGYPRPRSP